MKRYDLSEHVTFKDKFRDKELSRHRFQVDFKAIPLIKVQNVTIRQTDEYAGMS